MDGKCGRQWMNAVLKWWLVLMMMMITNNIKRGTSLGCSCLTLSCPVASWLRRIVLDLSFHALGPPVSFGKPILWEKKCFASMKALDFISWKLRATYSPPLVLQVSHLSLPVQCLLRFSLKPSWGFPPSWNEFIAFGFISPLKIFDVVYQDLGNTGSKRLSQAFIKPCQN